MTKIFCDLTRCKYNSARYVMDKENAQCQSNNISLSHFVHLIADNEKTIDCENYERSRKPFDKIEYEGYKKVKQTIEGE